MKRIFSKRNISLIIIALFALLAVTACQKKTENVEVSDVTLKLLESEGLSGCRIKEMAHYSTFEVELEDVDEYDDETIEFVRDIILEKVYETTVFELDDEQIEASELDEQTVTRYLMIGAIAYEKFGQEEVPDGITPKELAALYNELERRVVISYIADD